MHYRDSSGQTFTLAGAILSALLVYAMLYFWMPVFSYDFGEIYVILFIAALPVTLLSRPLWAKVVWVVALLLFVGTSFLTTSAMLHSEAYRDLLGKETAADFNSALPPINIDQAPLVSQDMALQAMQKRLSELGAQGSQLAVRPPVKQLFQGKLVWVAFLDHSGFFKWYKDEVTPGYFIVSANDPADVRLVMELHGQPLKMRYLESAYFGDHVYRHVYSSKFAMRTIGLTDFEPEIDDDGNPFYVGTTYEHKVGFSGGETTGIVTVNAVTGEVVQYALGKEPGWVDRIQPEEFVHQQMADRGEYIHGYINLNKEGMMQVEGDLDLVYGSDGRPYWIGGMASIGRNNGLSGFYFVDSRTKAVRWFKVPSVTQETAEHAVENVNPEKHYKATNPLPFLVGGVPTYVMAMRDGQGVSRAFGMVDMRNNQVIAVADTLSATLRSYQAKRSTNRVGAAIGTASQTVDLEGKVMRIASEFRNNQTMYYVTLDANEKYPGIIFTGSSDLSEELVLTKPGDTVQLAFSDSGTRVVGMSKFHNTDIPSPKTAKE